MNIGMVVCDMNSYGGTNTVNRMIRNAHAINAIAKIISGVRIFMLLDKKSVFQNYI